MTTPAAASAAAPDVARVGSFAGPSVAFGVPLQIVHPKDNRFPLFDPEIEALDISLEEKAKLQAEIENLSATLIVSRDT